MGAETVGVRPTPAIDFAPKIDLGAISLSLIDRFWHCRKNELTGRIA
jgi:hypothetical protein